MTSVVAQGAKNVVRKFSEIPGPRAFPVLGNVLHYKLGIYDIFKYHEVLKKLYRTYGPVVRERIGNKTIVHVFDLDDIKTVYSHEGKWPQVPPLQETTQIYRQQKKMSLGLGNTNGEEWYNLRSNSQQKLLRPKEVQMHLPVVNEVALDFVSHLRQIRDSSGQIVDLRKEVGKWSLENASAIVFDQKFGAFDHNETLAVQMIEANEQIFKLSGILKLSLPMYKVISTPKWRKLIKAEDFFYSHAISLVNDTLLRFQTALKSGQLEKSPNRFYLLSYLLSRESLSLRDVTIICLSLFSDGLSTTTPMLLFNLYCLAKYEDNQQKAFDEIKEVVGDDTVITESHVKRLAYLKAFIRETFRLWPNGTEVSRYTEEPIVLSGYQIPVGTHVDLNPSVHFRDPNVFEDPDLHLPERWLRSGSDDKAIHPYLLTPFGHGTRMCAGRRFAEQDMLVLLATILRNFKLKYPQDRTVSQVYNTLLFPDRRLEVQFEDRSN